MSSTGRPDHVDENQTPLSFSFHGIGIDVLSLSDTARLFRFAAPLSRPPVDYIAFDLHECAVSSGISKTTTHSLASLLFAGITSSFTIMSSPESVSTTP